MWHLKRKFIFNIMCMFLMIALFVFFLFFYGLVPNMTFPGLATNFWYLGEIEGEKFFHTTIILYPYGSYVNEGFYFYFVGKILYSIFGDEILSVTLTYLSIYTVSFISLILLGKYIFNNIFPIFLLVTLFFLDPFLLNNMGLQVVGYGMIISPLSLLCDYVICNKIIKRFIFRRYEYWWTMLFIFLCRLMIVSIGWYSAVSVFVFSTVLIMYVLCKKYKFGKFNFRTICMYFGIYGMPWAVAVGIVRLFMPEGISALSTSNKDFFNGNSVDIGTLFLPEKNQYISKLFSIEDFIPFGYSLTGDPSTWNNYLGISIICLSIISLLNVHSDRETELFRIGVFFSAIVGLILALGPGLKILGLTELSNIGKYKGYCLSMDEVIQFPWSNLYLLFPMNMMRAVYRWLLISKFALLLLASYGISDLYNGCIRKRSIAIFLSLFAVFEFWPIANVSDVVEQKIQNYHALNDIKQEIIYPLKDKVNKGETIAVCSYDDSDNGFILPYMMQQLNISTYAGCGDKSMALARKYVPEKILELQHEADSSNIVNLTNEVLDSSLCDGVLLPYFRIRWESYYWPWDRTHLKYKAKILNMKSALQDKYNVYENDYYIYVKRK